MEGICAQICCKVLLCCCPLVQELNTSAMTVAGVSSRDSWPFSAIGDFVSDAVGEVGDTVTMIANAGSWVA